MSKIKRIGMLHFLIITICYTFSLAGEVMILGESDYENEINGILSKFDLTEDLYLFDIIKKDFDKDGDKDFLLENNVNGGGNGAPNNYFFLINKNGKYEISDDIGSSYKSFKIKEINNETVIELISNNYGYNEDEPEEETISGILRNDELIIDVIKTEKLISIKEVLVSDFNSDDPAEKIILEYDLDGDNINEKIICSKWARWGAVLAEIKKGDKVILDNFSGKRIGILKSITNGMHDLVEDLDRVLYWNGHKYISEEE